LSIEPVELQPGMSPDAAEHPLLVESGDWPPSVSEDESACAHAAAAATVRKIVAQKQLRAVILSFCLSVEQRRS
jgi:hypothetical protein